LRKEEHEAKRQREEAEATRQWQEAEATRQREEAEATRQDILVLRRAEEENQQLQRRAHYQAVLAGEVFDLDLLVEELKNDWVELQRLGLTRAHITQGFKAASPAAGGVAWWLGAPPWIAVLIGISTYLASGPAGEGYVEIKFQEWRAKWAMILANCSATQLQELSETLRVRYPMVYGSMSVMGQFPPLQG